MKYRSISEVNKLFIIWLAVIFRVLELSLFLNDVDRGFVNQNTNKLNMTKHIKFSNILAKH